MAFQMDYKIPSGIDVPASYWVPAAMQLNLIKRQGSLVFNGYASQAAFAANNDVISQHLYTITPALFASFLQTVNLGTPAYAFALTILDTSSGQVDGQGNPVMVSFFKNATQI